MVIYYNAILISVGLISVGLISAGFVLPFALHLVKDNCCFMIRREPLYHGHATVDMQGLTGHIARFIRGEISRRGADILTVTKASGGDIIQ